MLQILARIIIAHVNTSNTTDEANEGGVIELDKIRRFNKTVVGSMERNRLKMNVALIRKDSNRNNNLQKILENHEALKRLIIEVVV